MGVSIGWRRPAKDKVTWLNPGWRSMMHQLLIDNDLCGLLEAKDVPTLRAVGKAQYRGKKDPPFDHGASIEREFEKLAVAIERHGAIVTVFEF